MLQLILDTIGADGSIPDSLAFARKHGKSHADEVVPALKKLEANEVIATELISVPTIELSAEAQRYAASGSPEASVWAAVSPQGTDIKALNAKLHADFGEDLAKIAYGQAMKNKWIRFEKKEVKKEEAAKEDAKKKREVEGTVFRAAEKIEDRLQVDLQKVLQALHQNSVRKDVEGVDLKALQNRKLVSAATIKYFKVSKGPQFSTKLETHAADITYEMIASGAWKGTSLKPLNLAAEGKKPEGGHLHPLLKVRAAFREILLEMGFSEMPTSSAGGFVESSFWNYDSLFQPQQHPARDAHDTFFIKEPARTLNIPADYLARVKKTHEQGLEGSIGWRYDWSEEEARKNLLRTHTTSVSARMLYKLAQEGWKPAKYFSIDRVFRNEAMDATHLCEFHQIEGLICDKGLTLGDLMGVIKNFYQKLGITQTRFKPAYNPYTEPSMEIFGFHPQLRKWVEIGNSGVFRPEMLRPMGLPEDVQVIAWGLGLERPTMILYKIENIRDLLGHKVSIPSIQSNPICRLDKVRK
jgi:phenylalanyl-tRNA synthetase alpha chain